MIYNFELTVVVIKILLGSRTLIRELALDLNMKVIVPYGAWFHKGQQAHEFNQRSLVKSGNTRLPEGSSGKDASGGINQVGDGSSILVGSKDIIFGSVPCSNFNFVASRDSRPADKGVYRVGDVRALNGQDGPVILETVVGQSLVQPVKGVVVDLVRGEVTQPERLIEVGSNNQNILLSDERIRPTVDNETGQSCSKISGPAGRKWKRAARNKPLVSSPDLNGVICSKRLILPVEGVFNDETKKPRFDASSACNDTSSSTDRGISCDSFCPVCSKAPETTSHALWGCHALKECSHYFRLTGNDPQFPALIVRPLSSLLDQLLAPPLLCLGVSGLPQFQSPTHSPSKFQELSELKINFYPQKNFE
ncbi:hypothetical protein LWI29_006817 [Acer saccharum]|uniref:Uncharacterized protein n=1 Tax=Acer saccharum TaxID=4024 RepID=A0AA39SIR6_ACESA|nr:hypothetical protein LWI29_006817 [Acer saccharum]